MRTKLSSYSEHELVTLLKSGSEPAFKELFVRFEQKLYHYTLKFTRSKEATEEILQDIFIKLWEYRENLDTTLSFNALMFRIAKNNILNYLRNESRQMSMRKEYSFSMEAMRNSTEEKIFFEEYIRMTDRAIDNLPAQRRSIFRMSRYEGKSYEEIAGVLGISKDTVRLQIIKSLKSLKKSMVTYVDMPVGILILPLMIF